VLRILHNPRYAGVFCFGRHRDRAEGDGTYIRQIKPREEWISFIPGAHPGYITSLDAAIGQLMIATLAPCHVTPQLVSVQERCITHADGVEIFLHAVFTRPQCCLLRNLLSATACC
jgi:hypothetical protein